MVYERKVIPLHNSGSLGFKLVVLFVPKVCLKMVSRENISHNTGFKRFNNIHSTIVDISSRRQPDLYCWIEERIESS